MADDLDEPLELRGLHGQIRNVAERPVFDLGGGSVHPAKSQRLLGGVRRQCLRGRDFVRRTVPRGGQHHSGQESENEPLHGWLSGEEICMATAVAVDEGAACIER